MDPRSSSRGKASRLKEEAMAEIESVRDPASLLPSIWTDIANDPSRLLKNWIS
jgi:hypothetical protein